MTETATYLQGTASVTDTYTGVSLWNLIQDAGLLTNPAIKNDVLNYIVVATGSDGYRASSHWEKSTRCSAINRTLSLMRISRANLDPAAATARCESLFLAILPVGGMCPT